MSEERIKERCKREDIALKIVEGFLEKYCDEDTELYYSLENLLDLYNKEKEKNKLLVQGKFREVTDKNSYIKDNYVSKDKIKELFKYKEGLVLDIENHTILTDKTKQEEKEVETLEIEMRLLQRLLQEGDK